MALAFLCTVPVIAAVAWVIDDGSLFAIDVFITFIMLGALAALRFAGSLRLAVHGMALGIAVGVVGYTLMLGGWAPGVAIWLALGPVLVQLILGGRHAVPWLAVAGLGTIGLFALDVLGLHSPRVGVRPAVEALDVAVFLFIAYALLRLHQRSQMAIRDELEAAKTAAESADAAKTALLAHISHELRTPLHGLVGASQLIATTDDLLERAELSVLIKTSGEALAAIVRDVLELSRIEADAFRVQPRPFRPRPLLESVAALCASGAQNRGLELRCDLSSEVPPWLLADEARLRQIVLNLLDNAVKYTDEGAVTVNADWRDDELHVTVRDSGVGIAPDDQAAIFEPFHRVDETADRETGLGLGLSICRRLAEAMGGSLTLASEPGEGSTFELALPAPQADTLALEPSDGAVAPTGLHLLLVEDDAVSRTVAVRLLERLGHTSRAAPTAQEALDALDEERFDAVLMDCRLPDLSGVDATRAIRRRGDALADIPVIALTANAVHGDEQLCLAAGMDAYLTKPLDVRALEAALARTAPNGGAALFRGVASERAAAPTA